MDLRLVEQSVSDLTEYGRLPIAFTVDRILEVTPIDDGLGGLALRETPVRAPYVKDYDSLQANRPTSLADRWDLSNWGMITGFVGELLVGGALLAFGSYGVDQLENRMDLTVLWDIRVHPEYRRRGVGQELFRAAETWAKARGCRQLKVETQNINVAACRFYARQGCILGAIHRHAYPEFPNEAMLLWYKDL